jgi:hypothetical protein
MNDYNLPKDLEIFLRSGKQLDYDAETTETGEIGLKSFYFKPYPNFQYIRGRPFLKIAKPSAEG